MKSALNHASEDNAPSTATVTFYQAMVQALQKAGVPFLVGGAYAFARYTGIHRHTKDFDIFVRESDLARTLSVLAQTGCTTELTFPHWLAKAYCGDIFIDVIFNSGNGVAAVDAEWFDHAVDEEVLGLGVRLVPPEEMLWSKAFVMERERFDGADVAHLLRSVGADLDWDRLLRRFGEYWRVLLSHLVLFGFVYPSEAKTIPLWVMKELMGRLNTELHTPPVAQRVCRGPLISREQYLTDIEQWDYRDARLLANGGQMSRSDIRDWTAAIEESRSSDAGGAPVNAQRDLDVELREGLCTGVVQNE